MAKLNDNQKAFVITVLLCFIFGYVNSADYSDSRQVECWKKGQGYNGKTDKCEGVR